MADNDENEDGIDDNLEILNEQNVVKFNPPTLTQGEIDDDVRIFNLPTLIPLRGSSSNIRFVQPEARKDFSDTGRFYFESQTGLNIRGTREMASAIKNGIVKSDTVKVGVVNHDGKTYIMDSRSYSSLKRAGIEDAKINFVDVTNYREYSGAKTGLERLLERTNMENNNGLEGFGHIKSECFLAGTRIDMWPLASLDGSDPALQPDADGVYDEAAILTAVRTKPIELITPEDWVVSPDKVGRLKPGRVTRTFQNRARHILDVPVPNFDEHGETDGTFENLMMTPGHVTYCAKVGGEVNKFADSHVPVIDILRTDGALMKEDGTKYRASTGCRVSSFEDQMILAVAGKMDDQGGLAYTDQGMIRLGTKYISDDGKEYCIADIAKAHNLEVKADSRLGKKGSSDGAPFLWSFTPMLPKPEDYVLQRSNLTLDEIYTVDEWEGLESQLPAPDKAPRQHSARTYNNVLQASAKQDMPPNVPTSMFGSANQPHMSRKQRRAHEAKLRKKSKAMRKGAMVH